MSKALQDLKRRLAQLQRGYTLSKSTEVSLSTYNRLENQNPNLADEGFGVSADVGRAAQVSADMEGGERKHFSLYSQAHNNAYDHAVSHARC